MYTNKGNRSSFHEDTCALSVKNARRDTYGRRHFCTKKLFNEGSFLLESKKKTKTYINKKRRKIINRPKVGLGVTVIVEITNKNNH